MKNILITLAFCQFFLFACQSENSQNTEKQPVSEEAYSSSKLYTLAKKLTASSINQANMIGIWTNSSTQNATVEISPDSILYLEGLEKYRYELHHDNLIIHFTDHTSKSKIVQATADTLILEDQSTGRTVFTRFRK